MWRIVFLLFLVGAAFSVGGSAEALAGLQYRQERISDDVTVILVYGDFAYNDDLSVFSALVQASRAKAVTFDSPGGSPQKAMELGRLIRSFNMATIQLRANECASACALAFLGGAIRLAEPGAIGVHKSSFSPGATISTADAVSAIQQLTAEIVAYMVQMGVDPSLLHLALSYDSDDIRYLSMSEMQQYRVVTTATNSNLSASLPQPAPPPSIPPPASPPPSVPSAASAPALPENPLLNLPQAMTGRVRHPKGSAPLKQEPEGKSRTVATFNNGSNVRIIGNSDRWYQVRLGSYIGYMHDTWVYVDQFDTGPFSERHIQIKSFDNFAEAQSFVRSSSIPVSAYVATNGWFAITLKKTYPQDLASTLTRAMKERGSIPEDSYVTYGNTYVRKVCCQ